MLVCGSWAGFRPSPVGTTVTANRRLHLQASRLSPDRICPQHLFFGQGQPKSPSKLCVFDLVAWLWSLKRHDAVCLARHVEPDEGNLGEFIQQWIEERHDFLTLEFGSATILSPTEICLKPVTSAKENRLSALLGNSVTTCLACAQNHIILILKNSCSFLQVFSIIIL